MMCPIPLAGSAWRWVMRGPGAVPRGRWVQLPMLKHLKQNESGAKGVGKAWLQSPAADGVRTGSRLSPLSWCPGKNTPFS